MQCQCVNLTGQQIRQQIVDSSMASDQLLIFKFTGNQHHPEMGFRSRRDVVLVAFVDYLKMLTIDISRNSILYI